MIDVVVIILTKDEKLHIGRCLEKIVPLGPRQVFVVDCFSSDGTQEIVEKFSRVEREEHVEVYVVEHKWPGNQAAQFNWALDNLHIKASWVLRLDADEYLYPETIQEIRRLLPKWNGERMIEGGLSPSITSLSLSRARRYLQMNIRFGGRDVELVRLFKFGFGRSAQSEMDEHIVTSSGENLKLKGKFVDDSLISLEAWKEKHRDYAIREANMVLNGRVNKNKSLYYMCPPYFRAFAYFCYRYFLRLGFFDGYAGWRWNFWQGLWYRCLVDRNILRMKRENTCKK